jgi:Xaa-Pro aminopeptidase
MEKPTFDYQGRCQRVQSKLDAAGIDALLVGASSDLLYLIGLNRPATERLTLLMIPRQGRIRLILPGFERELAEPLASFFDLATWEETEDPAALFASLLPEGGRGLKLAVAGKLLAHFLFRLQEAAPQADFVPASTVIDALRLRKEPQELEYLTAAGAAADRTFEALMQTPLIGASEIELKARLMEMMTAHGHHVAGGGIVGVGSHSASPHHHVSSRQIAPGDAVVIDFGGMVHGYWSDMTRSFHAGPPSDEYIRAYNTVNEANQKAFEAIRPGMTAESIDRVAREHITQAGYGEYFLHRTGHGLGLDVHEAPYIIGGDQTVLEEGMVFSVEPGIYIRGRFGIRIEDIVTVTADGARRFNLSSHELRIIE